MVILKHLNESDSEFLFEINTNETRKINTIFPEMFEHDLVSHIAYETNGVKMCMKG